MGHGNVAASYARYGFFLTQSVGVPHDTAGEHKPTHAVAVVLSTSRAIQNILLSMNDNVCVEYTNTATVSASKVKQAKSI